LFLRILSTALTILLRIQFASTKLPINNLIRALFPVVLGVRVEIWPQLSSDPAQVKRRNTLNRISGDVQRFIRNPRNPRQRIRPYILRVKDRVLMLFIRLRSYPTFTELGL